MLVGGCVLPARQRGGKILFLFHQLITPDSA